MTCEKCKHYREHKTNKVRYFYCIPLNATITWPEFMGKCCRHYEEAK